MRRSVRTVAACSSAETNSPCRGLDHSELLNDVEREAFETAHEVEHEEICLFRLKAIFVLM